jgi:hypothetical protein
VGARPVASQLSDAHIELLAGLPHPVTSAVDGFGDVLFCHGSSSAGTRTWAVVADGVVSLRRTESDPAAACASIIADSSYPDVVEFVDFFVHARASDAEAIATFGPLDGR